MFRQRTAARVIVAAAVCVILLAANVSGDKASELRCLRGSTTHKAEPEREEDLDNHVSIEDAAVVFVDYIKKLISASNIEVC